MVFVNSVFNRLFQWPLKTGLSLLDETVNQACANKYLETVFSESEMKIINDYNVFEKRLSYMLVISDFLNVYENNRKKYKWT